MCVSLKNEIKDLKTKYLEREKEFENSLVKVKQQVENWEKTKANDMLSIAFKVSGITIKGLEPLINCLIDKLNAKQDVINRKTEEIENLKRESSEKLGKTQRYIDHMKREKYGGAQVLRTKLLNWKNYFVDLEMDHYEGLKICNNKIWELQDELEWSKKNGRKIKAGEGKMNQ